MESIEQTRLRLEAAMKEVNPDADLAPGSVLGELLVKAAAYLHNPIKNDIDELNTSKSVADALASEKDTYNEIIDNIASNFNVSRDGGKQAEGKIKVTVTERRNYFVDEGFTFIQPDIQIEYATTKPYTIVTSNDVGDGEIKLIQEGSLYYYIVPVEAKEAGAAAQVSDKAKFVLADTDEFTQFVQAEAYGTFASGKNIETDKELITRYKLGLTTKNLVSPNAIRAVLKERFPGVKDISVIGSNDPAMQRNKDNIFGFATPGMADVYVRSSESVEHLKIVKTGTQITDTNDSNLGKWSITIDAVDAPGFYRIISIIPNEEDVIGTQVFTSISYDIYRDTEERNNSIETPTEARFTKYQKCTVIFEYDGAGAAEKEFIVTVAYQPAIKEIQDLFLSDNERIACADYLVKAVIPCNVSVNLKLIKKNASDTIPVDSIKKDIYNYINNIPFGEDLSASKIIDICHDYNINRVDLPVFLSGSITLPSAVEGDVINLNSTDRLVIPEDIAKGVSPKNTLFFINYFDAGGDDNIGIEVL